MHRSFLLIGLIPLILSIGITPTFSFAQTMPDPKLNPDTSFTAATFADKYKDIILQDDGTRIPVLIKVIGEPTSDDPNKRPREIRYLQTYVLKFLKFAEAINSKSDLWNNELTTQIHPLWIEELEKRSDVISVIVLDENSIEQKEGSLREHAELLLEQNREKYGESYVLPPYFQKYLQRIHQDIVCKEGLELTFKSANSEPICVKPITHQKLIARGWAVDLRCC